MSRILLVDGNSIINRAFFAVIGRAPMTAPDGTPTGAVNGFFNTILSVKDEYKPDNICVLFDLKVPTFRHKMSADYKATRKGMPPELSQQMPVVKELLDLMGIKRMELATYEADDLIGTLSRQGEENGDEVFILSGDHDDFQLISDKVKVILPQSGKGKPPRVLYDRELFIEENGVTPDVFVYVKALMGDNSDNIKGVDKVGPKTAFKLIADYGDIDGVLANTDKMTPALRANLDKSHELLELNIKLCTIDRHVPVPYNVDETAFAEIADAQGLFDRLSALGLKMLIKKLGLDNMRASAAALQADAGENGNEFEDIAREASVLLDNITLRYDTPSINEGTTSLGVDFSGDKALVAIPGSSEVYVIDAQETPKLFEQEKVMPVGFAYKEKSKVMDRMLPNVDSVFDTAIAGYVFNMIDGAKPDMGRLYESLFHIPYPIVEDDGPKQMSLFGESDEEKDTNIKNAAKKLIVNNAIYKALVQKIEKEKKEKLLYDIEFPLVVTLDAIERNGMYVSGDQLTALHTEFASRLGEIESKIYDCVGQEFNIGSPKQLSSILFDADKLNLPHGKKGKTGVYSTSIEELTRLRTYHPVIDMIIEYRGLSKLDSTYAVGLKDKIASDGRIHTTFTQAMTNTGRLSSTEPNLQNIPIRSEEGGRIRECFIAPQGRVLVDADYSQIELRLLAAMSKDEVMCDAFLSNQDIHKRTAMKVFGLASEEDVTSRQRAIAKTVNFSIVYGVSEYGLSSDLQISYSDAANLIKEYGVQFPGITGFLDSLKVAGEKLGYVETLFGRRRVLTELSSQNRNIRNFGLRAAMNTPIQGTAADIIKIAMNKVYRALSEKFPNAKLVMQVHDELIIECDESDAQAVSVLLKEEMESAINLAVPLTADVHSGSNWLEAK